MGNFLSNPWTITTFGGLIVGIILLAIQGSSKKRHGLHIINATYGKNNSNVDITDKLNSLIVKNKLKIKLSNDIAGDPIATVPKIGRVKYRLNGKVLEKEFVESELIELP